MNVKKVFQVDKCSKRDYDFLYKLYSKGKQDTHIHNLSNVKNFPIEFKSLLNLGLKYCNKKPPKPKLLRDCVDETIRKIGWKVHFMINPSNKEYTELDKWHATCVRNHRKKNQIPNKRCDFEDEIADIHSLTYELLSNVRRTYKPSAELFKPTINKLKVYCEQHCLKIVEADKNAGICIVNKTDYDNEVLKQLNNLTIYHPSTHTHFEYGMIQFKDRVKLFEKVLPTELKLSRFHSTEDRPAKFYILIKIHKKYDSFPKGRPISSTVCKTNKPASKLLDLLLKPCLNSVSDLLIDTQHFLLLLNNLKLNPTKKYALVTVDVEALYPSLNISDCKKHCSDAYMNYISENEVNFKLSRKSFLELMSLSLDYNYVEYENDMYFQHQGIEMGNAASVAVANITVFHEIATLFSDNEAIAFYKRFLDDIFLLVDLESIDNLDVWLTNLLQHRYLKFTYEHSLESINFLDVQVSIHENNSLQTSLYTKPMSRHMYLHANSDHPSHLKNSLFYSQGLRIVRICSDFNVRLNTLNDLYKKFVVRDYTQSILYPALIKLIGTSRERALEPKRSFLRTYLSMHNPEIVNNYNALSTIETQSTKTHSNDNNMLYAVFPFYKSVFNYKQTIRNAILQHVKAKSAPRYKVYVESLCLRIVFSRTTNLKEELKV